MEQSEVITKIEQALEEIRPFLNKDGGDIKLVNVENNTVIVAFEGNCVHCSVNQMTLKSGVELTIKRYVPHIEKVINIGI